MAAKTLENQAIALAGVVQSSWLVDQIAVNAATQADVMQASIGSVLKIDAANVLDVFGGLAGIKTGLQILEEQFAGGLQSQQARYVLQLLQLERQLNQRSTMQRDIQTGITRIQSQAQQFGLLHTNVLASLAELYLKTISTLQPRIMVKGDPHHLADTQNVNKIRASLLAGIRSAVLWRQCGGSAWTVMLKRKALFREIRHLRDQLA